MPAFLKKGKFIAYLMILFFILFFTMDFGAVDLQKVAVIVTLGLDYNGEEELYTLSGQVVSSAGQNASTQTQTIIKGTGLTPAMALKNMEDTSGWHPYICFCKLIILSKTVLEKDIINVLDFFIRSEQLSDTAIICAAENSAVEIIESKTDLDEISTFALLKSLLYNEDSCMNVLATNLKDFTLNFYNESNGNILTYIKIIKENSEITQPALNEPPKSSKTATGEKVIFDTTSSAVFMKENFAGILNSQETKAYNLISKKTKLGQIDVKHVSTGKYFIENCSLEIVKSSFKKKIDFNNDRISCNIKVKADFKIDHLESTNKDLKSLINSQNVPEELKEELARTMKTDIENMIETVKSYNSDIFEIEETLFRFHPKKYRNYKKIYPDSFLQNTDFIISIELNPVSS